MSTERPTPRTDEHIKTTNPIHYVRTDFARQLERELAEAREENTKLRAALANSELPCVYCKLPANEIGKCESGFPGCSRADDQMGCPHLGAALELNKSSKTYPQPLPRPDKPGWWWCWASNGTPPRWVPVVVHPVWKCNEGIWVEAVPPPAPEKGVEE